MKGPFPSFFKELGWFEGSIFSMFQRLQVLFPPRMLYSQPYEMNP